MWGGLAGRKAATRLGYGRYILCTSTRHFVRNTVPGHLQGYGVINTVHKYGVSSAAQFRSVYTRNPFTALTNVFDLDRTRQARGVHDVRNKPCSLITVLSALEIDGQLCISPHHCR